jgi:hypothetical protein
MEIFQFYWIPGHCGIEVNERADSEAKQAIKEADYYYQWHILKPSGQQLTSTKYRYPLNTCTGVYHYALIEFLWACEGDSSGTI